MKRAERFSILAQGQDQAEYSQKATDAGTKAILVHPLAINCYEFARILVRLGRQAEAKAMFAQFLSRITVEQPNEFDALLMKERDVSAAIIEARNALL